MKKLLYLLLFPIIGFSQGIEKKIIDNDSLKKNSVFLEFLGNNTSILSLHFVRKFKILNKGVLNYELAAGYNPNIILDDGADVYGTSFMINWSKITNKNQLKKNRNHISVGMGLSYSSGLYYGTRPLKAGFLPLKLSYHLQKEKSDFFIKVSLVPTFRLIVFKNESGYIFTPIIGFAFGSD